jgi:hyperosmotically inducible periplasmic protein
MKRTSIATAVAAALTLATSAAFADSFTGAAKDAWLTGKIETAFVLNANLNPFDITTDVDGGMVHLMGVVKTDIDRDLAGELARGVEGVTSVENDLKVDAAAGSKAAEARNANHRDFGSWFDDATTTARVKTRLIGNSNIKALKIDVDTKNDVVTLTGHVQTKEQKTLAGEIARNTGDVKDVQNKLMVDQG